MKEYKSLIKIIMMLASFYFRTALYTVTGIMLAKWINNDQRVPPVSAEYWNTLYLAGTFFLVVLSLIFLADLIRFYRNMLREPVIAALRHQRYPAIAALAGGGSIFLLIINYWYPFFV